MMNIFTKIKNKFQATRQEFKSDKENAQKEGNLFKVTCQWIYKLRSVFLSIPVIFGTIFLAVRNAAALPEEVSIYFPKFSDGLIKISMATIGHTEAVIIPVLITVIALIMMFISRRVCLPWLVSMFSLTLPVFFWFTSVFPG
ncbi:MAG: hypothetical protein J6C41_07115 [Oscillospiraceae bacterium]|nr:hypothetical protein [Oscillospiraceae bacterium]